MLVSPVFGKTMFSLGVVHFRTPCSGCGHFQPTSCLDQCGSTLRSAVDVPFGTVEELLAASSGVCCQTWHVMEGSRDLSLL